MREGRSIRLELQLCGELDATRTSASEERIADADVASCGKCVRTSVPSGGGIRISDVGRKSGKDGTGKVGMIENVKELCAQGQVHFLSDCSVLEDRKVEFLERWTTERVASQATEMSCARNAIGLVGGPVIERIAPRAGCSERSQVEEVVRQAAIVNRTDHIRPIEALTRS